MKCMCVEWAFHTRTTDTKTLSRFNTVIQKCDLCIAEIKLGTECYMQVEFASVIVFNKKIQEFDFLFLVKCVLLSNLFCSVINRVKS